MLDDAIEGRILETERQLSQQLREVTLRLAALEAQVARPDLDERVHALAETVQALATRSERIEALDTTIARVDRVEWELRGAQAALDGVAESTRAVASDLASVRATSDAARAALADQIGALRQVASSCSASEAQDMATKIRSLKAWTGKASATIVYDSRVDPFTHAGLFSKVFNRPNVALIGETRTGDVFGAFYSVPVREQDQRIFDPTIFAFVFEAHGRCATPQKFALRGEVKQRASVSFLNSSLDGFVWFGVSTTHGFHMGNHETTGTCEGLSTVFDGMEDSTLAGRERTRTDPLRFTRLVAVHLV